MVLDIIHSVHQVIFSVFKSSQSSIATIANKSAYITSMVVKYSMPYSNCSNDDSDIYTSPSDFYNNFLQCFSKNIDFTDRLQFKAGSNIVYFRSLLLIILKSKYYFVVIFAL